MRKSEQRRKRPREHGQADLAREDVDMAARFFFHLRAALLDERHVGRAAHESDVAALADEAVGAGGEVVVEPALRLPARAMLKAMTSALGANSCCQSAAAFASSSGGSIISRPRSSMVLTPTGSP